MFAEVALLLKMSLISQNVDQLEKVKRKASDQPSLLEADQEIEDRKEDKSITYKIKKRKEERKQEDKQLEIEEGKKMKLENFLFGSLNSPVEFGKEDDEELRDGVDKSSALFFTDKSVNSVLSVYEDDAEFRESSESDDEDEAGQRKPVWVDDEEEKASINIAKVNRLRKLRKEEDESLISSSAYVSRLRAHHVKLNPGTEWAQRDSQPRNCSSDDEDSDIENGVVLARGCKDVEGVDDIL
ncbi:unnamed protein product [Camellia sinensis]